MVASPSASFSEIPAVRAPKLGIRFENAPPFGNFVKLISILEEFRLGISGSRVSKCPIPFWVGFGSMKP